MTSTDLPFIRSSAFSVGPPPPAREESETLKRTREAEEQRMEPKRIKTERDSLKMDSYAEMIARQKAKMRQWTLAKLLREAQEGMNKGLAQEELERRRAAVTPDEERKRFIMEVENMPLGVLRPSVLIPSSIAALRNAAGRAKYLADNDYVHLTAAQIADSPVLRQRLAEHEKVTQTIALELERETEEEQTRIRKLLAAMPRDGRILYGLVEFVRDNHLRRIKDIAELPEWQAWQHANETAFLTNRLVDRQEGPEIIQGWIQDRRIPYSFESLTPDEISALVEAERAKRNLAINEDE